MKKYDYKMLISIIQQLYGKLIMVELQGERERKKRQIDRQRERGREVEREREKEKRYEEISNFVCFQHSYI